VAGFSILKDQQMSRNGSGTMAIVNTFVAGNTITAAGHNQNMTDIASEITNSVAVDGQSTMTAPLKASSGSVSNPAYTFGSAASWGIYKTSTGLGFSIAGTKAAEFGPTGLVYGGFIVRPQGRLTLTSATPVLTSSVTAASTIYYTPYQGNVIPIYDGTSFVNTVFTELSLAMSGANFVSGGIYDLFVASDSGTLRLAIGPVWTTLTVGSGARGTGAGTTELEMKLGIMTNKVSMTARYASGSTFTVAANQGTYVGTVYLTAQAQTSVTFGTLASNGGAGTFGLWNTYNRVPFVSVAADNTNTWAYATPAWRAANNSSTIRNTFVVGLAEDAFVATYNAVADMSSQSGQAAAGVGYDATNGFYGVTAAGFNSGGSAISFTLPAVARTTPTIGLHFVSAIELGNGTTTYYGDGGGSLTQTGMALEWQN
jgi:hypothetical protein